MKRKLTKLTAGRIRPAFLALLLILLGLIDERFWKLGLFVMLVLFIEATVRYTRIH